MLSHKYNDRKKFFSRIFISLNPAHVNAMFNYSSILDAIGIFTEMLYQTGETEHYGWV